MTEQKEPIEEFLTQSDYEIMRSTNPIPPAKRSEHMTNINTETMSRCFLRFMVSFLFLTLGIWIIIQLL